MTDLLNNEYDAVVIGGGAAGLSGALMLARARRSVAVIDAGQPRNAPAEGIHGLLGREGMAPGELLETGRAEVRGYGAHVVTGEVTGASRDGDRFLVTIGDGRTVRARRLLVTTGLVDDLPDIPGVREQWGRGVVHCPYCHGWEIHDRAIGVLGTGPMSVHQALLFRQWSGNVTYFQHTQPAPDAGQAEQLAARGIAVVTGEVAEVDVDNTYVRLENGTRHHLEALAIGARMTARAAFLKELGLQPVQHPSGAGEHIAADPAGRTEVPGVFAAGNVTDLMAQVGAAAAGAAMAAAMLNADLITEETAAAVTAYRRN